MSGDWDGKGVRMPAGMGVIHWQGQIVVYQTQNGEVSWARLLGADSLPISEALRSAILADRAPDTRS